MQTHGMKPVLMIHVLKSWINIAIFCAEAMTVVSDGLIQVIVFTAYAKYMQLLDARVAMKKI
jgi:hypothetical protein